MAGRMLQRVLVCPPTLKSVFVAQADKANALAGTVVDLPPAQSIPQRLHHGRTNKTRIERTRSGPHQKPTLHHYQF